MKKFQLKKGSSFQDRNIVSLEAKFRALQLVGEGKSSKEALSIVAQEYNMDSLKSSWTRYAGSTISRFRADIQNKISQDNPDALRLTEKYNVAQDIQTKTLED